MQDLGDIGNQSVRAIAKLADSDQVGGAISISKHHCMCGLFFV